MLLTKTSTPVIGWVAILLGYIMNWIYYGQSAIGLESIGLAIILFTIVINMLMTPLTIQQQKFSRLSAKMNPELQAIQKKYKGKNSDQAAMAKMNEETQAVYAKYGVNPMGSCLQMAIQLPVLFALYRVIWNVPAYVDKVRNTFMPLITELMTASGAEKYMSEVASSLHVSFGEMTNLTLVDVLYKFKPENWTALAKQFPDMAGTITGVQREVDKMNYFLGLNIADSPMNILKNALSSRSIGLIIGAVMIPFLAWLSQYANAKLMGNQNDQGGNDQAAQTMKTMNTVMPLMSAVFCLTLPVGMGIYWIAGAVVRSIQQLVINKKIDKIDIEELAKANMDKINKKRAKKGLPPEKMKNNATMSTRNIEMTTSKNYDKLKKNEELQRQAAQIDSSALSSSKAKKGSIASKANMVAEFNETHKKK